MKKVKDWRSKIQRRRWIEMCVGGGGLYCFWRREWRAMELEGAAWAGASFESGMYGAGGVP
jgi:hypothetical protein